MPIFWSEQYEKQIYKRGRRETEEELHLESVDQVILKVTKPQRRNHDLQT